MYIVFITKSRTYLLSFHDNKPTVFNTSGFVGSHSFPAHSVYTAWWAMVSSSSPFSKLPLPFCNFFIFSFQSIFQMSEKDNFCILTTENTSRLIWLYTSFFLWFTHIHGCGFCIRRTPTKENLYRDLCYSNNLILMSVLEHLIFQGTNFRLNVPCVSLIWGMSFLVNSWLK